MNTRRYAVIKYDDRHWAVHDRVEQQYARTISKDIAEKILANPSGLVWWWTKTPPEIIRRNIKDMFEFE